MFLQLIGSNPTGTKEQTCHRTGGIMDLIKTVPSVVNCCNVNNKLFPLATTVSESTSCPHLNGYDEKSMIRAIGNTCSFSSNKLSESGYIHADITGWPPNGKFLGKEYNFGKNAKLNAFEVEVVPDYDISTWVKAPTGDFSVFDACDEDKNNSTPWENLNTTRLPKLWTGYKGNDVDDKRAGLRVVYPCKDDIDTLNKYLCSVENYMSPETCYGNKEDNKLSTKEGQDYAILIDDDKVPNRKLPNGSKKYYYDIKGRSIRPEEYPRGKGRCYYPINVIKNNKDAKIIYDGVVNGKLPPDVGNALLKEYCYKIVTGDCGTDAYGVTIKNCPRMIAERYSKDVDEGICKKWANAPVNKDKNIPSSTEIDIYNRDFCNNYPKYKACDCINSEREAGPENEVRNQYIKLIDVGDNAVPNKYCWFNPCINSDYTLKEYHKECGDMNFCLNIIDFEKSKNVFVKGVTQDMKCSMGDGGGGGGGGGGDDDDEDTTTTTTEDNNFFKNLSTEKKIILGILLFIILIIIAIKMNEQRSIKPSVQRPVQRPIQPSVQRPIQRPIQPSVQRPIQRPIQPSVQRPVQRPIQPSVQRPV